MYLLIQFDKMLLLNTFCSPKRKRSYTIHKCMQMFTAEFVCLGLHKYRQEVCRGMGSRGGFFLYKWPTNYFMLSVRVNINPFLKTCTRKLLLYPIIVSNPPPPTHTHTQTHTQNKGKFRNEYNLYMSLPVFQFQV